MGVPVDGEIDGVPEGLEVDGYVGEAVAEGCTVKVLGSAVGLTEPVFGATDGALVCR